MFKLKENQQSLHSRTCNLLFYVITLSTISLTQFAYSIASVSHPILLSAANHFFLFKALCIQRFPKMKLTMKFKTDGPELPATDASNLSF
jgi:hypothetical protein